MKCQLGELPTSGHGTILREQQAQAASRNLRPPSESPDVRKSCLSQRRRLQPRDQGDPDPQGIARRPMRDVEQRRRLAHRDRRRSRRIPRRADSFFFATASADGQPYIQHRGGPKGSSGARQDRRWPLPTIGGNRQYITHGNLVGEPEGLYLPDGLCASPARQDLGRGRVIEDDPALLASLMPADYQARPEQVILFKLTAWDTNCKQHIPQKFDAADVSGRARDPRRADRGTGAELADAARRACGVRHGLDAVRAIAYRRGEHEHRNRHRHRFNQPLPGLRRVLLLFAQLAALHHRGRRGAGSDPGAIRQRAIVGDAVRRRALLGVDRQGRRSDGVWNLCGAAGGVPDLHAGRHRMRHGAAPLRAAGAAGAGRYRRMRR